MRGDMPEAQITTGPRILPVTALAVIETSNSSILAIGQGSSLSLRHLTSGLSTSKTTASQLVDSAASYASCCAEVLVGQAIHGIVSLAVSESPGQTKLKVLVYGGDQIVLVEVQYRADSAKVEILDALQTVNEWLLTANSISASENAVVCLTSYNTVSHISYHETNRELRQHILSDKLSTFLYSGTVQVVSQSHYLVASGTALGQVLLWTCFRGQNSQSWQSAPLRQFEGHRGSIFGVSMSPAFTLDGQASWMVASCSDDRTIHLWDVSAMESESVDCNDKDMKAFVKSTASLAMTWGHLSRIWTVQFLRNKSADAKEFTDWLISTGEDGTVQSWLLHSRNMAGDSGKYSLKITNIHQDRHHTGKNVWSHCHNFSGDSVDFYSGGADGRIVQRCYRAKSKSVHEGTSLTQSLSSPSQSPINGGSFCADWGTPKYYQLVDCHLLVCSTDKGILLFGSQVVGHVDWTPIKETICRSSLFAFDHTFQNVLIADESSNHLVRLHITSESIDQIGPLANGKIAFLKPASIPHDHYNTMCIAVSYYSAKQIQLWMIDQLDKPRHCINLDLPEAFTVSAALYDEAADVLVCGSRAGALTVYRNVTTNSTMMSCTRHVHRSDTVTQIVKLSLVDDRRNFYLTTGRDGTYCIHEIDLDSIHVKTVHRSIPPLGPYVEGAHIIRQPDGVKRIILHGFRSTDFVVWDETDQRQLFAVHCGGAHRSWAFHLDASGTSATFVWTQAGKFNYKHWYEIDHEVLQRGSHGREIKAFALYRKTDHEIPLMATGSEDTNIHLMTLTAKGTDFRTLMVLRKHTTGLQDLAFSPDGDVLFSAAGMEELFAWSITQIPGLGYGTVFASSLPRTETHSDARIMAIDVRAGQDNSYDLVAAFSNGHFELIRYRTRLATFEVLKVMDAGSICLTQAVFLSHELNLFAGAATDGEIRMYDTLSTASKTRHKVHQNSVTALEVVQLDSESLLAITGGDDNALAVTLVKKGASSTIRIPSAHAAALTTLKVIQNGEYGYVVVTAGNDQRVKIWSLYVEKRPLLKLENMEIQLLKDEYTNVADISELEVLSFHHEPDLSGEPSGDKDPSPFQVLVVGVGLEVLDMTL